MSSFRITMGMKMNTYRYNLMQSTNTLASSQEKVQTHRKFNSYAESPAEATQAWRVRRDFMDNDSFQRNNKDTYTRFQTAWLTMGSVKTHLEDATGRTATIRGLNDATAAAKTEVGGVLKNTAETIIQAMNGAKYGEEFVFSGTDGATAPFSWDESGNLLYRGINITPPDNKAGWKDYSKSDTPAADDWGWGKMLNDEGIPENFLDDPKYAAYPPNTYVEATGETLIQEPTEPPAPEMPIQPIKPEILNNPNADTTSPEYIDAEQKYNDAMTEYTAAMQVYEDEMKDYIPKKEAYDKEKAEYDEQQVKKGWYEYFQNQRTLNKLSEEVQYADLGMGMKEITDENGNTKMVGSTVFNNATPGINMLGYGVDEDGDPKNLVLIMKELGELLSSCDEEGNFPNPGDKDRAFRLFAKFDEASALTLKGYTYTDVQGKFLQANGTTLEDQGYNLNDQIADLEQVDMAQAISMFMWDYSCYSAGLKIGTQLLSESLLDYMR